MNTFTKDPSTHPAHSPLTEERLIRVREWLQSALAYSEGSNRDYMMADAAKAIDELLALRKAGQEPVIEVSEGDVLSEIFAPGTKLYAAPQLPQPALAAPKEITFEQAMLEVRGLSPAEAYQKAWNRRAATLQGAVPVQGWIPCSERMPEWSDDVLCATEFDGPGDWRKKVGYWHESKWVIYGASWTPTHWMPLPAAPRQEA